MPAEIRAPGCGQGIAACVDTWFGTSKFDVIHFSERHPSPSIHHHTETHTPLPSLAVPAHTYPRL